MKQESDPETLSDPAFDEPIVYAKPPAIIWLQWNRDEATHYIPAGVVTWSGNKVFEEDEPFVSIRTAIDLYNERHKGGCRVLSDPRCDCFRCALSRRANP